MDQVSAYALLADRLNHWQSLPREQIALGVGAPGIVESVSIGGELVSIEVSVHWTDLRKTRLLVKAIAYGPSHWKTERLEEKMIFELFDQAKP